MRVTIPIELSTLYGPMVRCCGILPWTHVDDAVRRDVIAMPRTTPVTQQLLFDLGIGHLFSGKGDAGDG